MAQLVVRSIENEVKSKLQKRAKRHGRSMEEEVREILRDAARSEKEESSKKGLGTQIVSRFRKIGLREGEEIPELRGFTIEPPDFGE